MSIKPFDPGDFATLPAPKMVKMVADGVWNCSVCAKPIGAVETSNGWETFVPNQCLTQQTCSDQVAELAELHSQVSHKRKSK